MLPPLYLKPGNVIVFEYPYKKTRLVVAFELIYFQRLSGPFIAFYKPITTTWYLDSEALIHPHKLNHFLILSLYHFCKVSS